MQDGEDGEPISAIYHEYKGLVKLSGQTQVCIKGKYDLSARKMPGDDDKPSFDQTPQATRGPVWLVFSFSLDLSISLDNIPFEFKRQLLSTTWTLFGSTSFVDIHDILKRTGYVKLLWTARKGDRVRRSCTCVVWVLFDVRQADATEPVFCRAMPPAG